ncbi:CheY-like chemotaxis protein [Granulicella aggregans]|uniref:CheY-like chemotaxis protein n=1 Tax=Granulicella aggregans TaxID=474949 RepID=A0A7W7ZJ99_9BACT|nr:CheY-like chemotaxis protein [Granulicella aggregans]
MVASTLQMISSAQEISVMRLPQQLKAGNDRYVRSFDGPLLAPSNVLLYGHDLHLSGSRKILLESVGYKVRFAGNADEALLRVMRTPIQLLIVCHTVPFESAEKLLLVARTSQPVVRVLVLTAAKPTPYQHLGEEVHDTADGPAMFLAKVQNLALMNLRTN